MNRPNNYIIEFYQLGGSVKVSAIDPASGHEVSIVGAATESRAKLSRVAVQKLEYMLTKADKR